VGNVPFVFARSGTVTEDCTGKGGLTERELIESMCDETINSKVDEADMVEGGSTKSSEDCLDCEVMRLRYDIISYNIIEYFKVVIPAQSGGRRVEGREG
jgi:hypothetical protein